MNRIKIPFGGFRESLYWYDVDNAFFDFIQSPTFDEMRVKDVKNILNKITPEVRAKVNQDIAEHYVMFLNLVIIDVFSLERSVLVRPVYNAEDDTISAEVSHGDSPTVNWVSEVARLWGFDYDAAHKQVKQLCDNTETVDSPWSRDHFLTSLVIAGLVTMHNKYQYTAEAREGLTAADALRFLEVDEFYEDCFVPHGGIVHHLKKVIEL